MENTITRTICIYPGRFQPFSAHHYQSYKTLAMHFGVENVFIAPSKTTGDIDNPLTPFEKVAFIKIYGIPEEQIIPVTSPYKAIEIVQNFDSSSTSVVFAYGEKDAARIRFTKTDGTPSWFQPYKGQCDVPYSVGGYAYIVPTITVKQKNCSSSDLRVAMINGLEYVDFCKQMQLRPTHEAWQIYSLLKQKLTPKPEPELSQSVLSKGKGKHLMHPWEDPELTYPQILQMVKVSCIGNLKYCIEKFDGQNFMVTVSNGKVLAARNKSEIVNPLSKEQLGEKFAGRGSITDAFVWAMTTLEKALQNCDKTVQNIFIPDKWSFLNVEVLYQPTKNVFDYGTNPKLVVHSINRYDVSGNEIGRIIDVEPLVANMGFRNIFPPRPVKIEFCPEVYTQFKKDINALWLQHNLKMNQKLEDLYVAIAPEYKLATSIKAREKILREDVYPIIEVPFMKAGATMLKNATGYYNHGGAFYAMKLIRDTPEYNTNPELVKHVIRIAYAGGIEMAVPFEGVVFEYNDNLYKWTGLFAPINQILGYWRYKR